MFVTEFPEVVLSKVISEFLALNIEGVTDLDMIQYFGVVLEV